MAKRLTAKAIRYTMNQLGKGRRASEVAAADLLVARMIFAGRAPGQPRLIRLRWAALPALLLCRFGASGSPANAFTPQPGYDRMRGILLAVLALAPAILAGSASAYQYPDGAFVTTWETTEPRESISFDLTGDYTIDWGDGASQSGSADLAYVEDASGWVGRVPNIVEHRYDHPGTYRVTIYGDLTSFRVDYDTAPKLASVDQWGDSQWKTMERAFRGAVNMMYSATDAPDLSEVDSMAEMFFRAFSFNGSISSWDVSGVTNMSKTFSGAHSFNGDLSGWDVSAVTDMSQMFYLATSFNGDISGWDVSAVTDISSMFGGAFSFNGDISTWDVGSVTNMSKMFADANSFNGNISSWDVSAVTTTAWMFRDADSFNQPLGGWDISGMTDMFGMFWGADSFNQPLNDWDVSGVGGGLHSIFQDASSFHQNLGNWHINLDDHTVTDSDPVVGHISAQNEFLYWFAPTYTVVHPDDGSFTIDPGRPIMMGSAPFVRPDGTVPLVGATMLLSPGHDLEPGAYSVTIRADGERLYGSNNTRTVEVVYEGLVSNQHQVTQTAPTQPVQPAVLVAPP